MKAIFYVLSVLVIGAAAFISYQNSAKLQDEIDLFGEEQTKKNSVEKTTEDREKDLADTEADLEASKSKNADLRADMENMKSRELSYNKSKEAAQVKIDEADEKLADLAAVKAKIDEAIAKATAGANISWAEIPEKIKELKETHKKKSDDLDLLNQHVAKLTKDVGDKRAKDVREGERLAKMRERIGLNGVVGAVTEVNSTWGFVIVNLGSTNSNVTTNSKLLVMRDGRLLGRLSPNSVEPKQSVCDLNARDINPGVRIQPGDKVTLAEAVTGQ